MSCPSTDFDNQSAFSKMMDGIGYGTICLPLNYQNTLMVIFPPFYVILDQYKKGFPVLIRLL